MTPQELVSAISDVVEAGNSFVISDTETSLWFYPSVCLIDGVDVNIQCYAIAYENTDDEITTASLTGLKVEGSSGLPLTVTRCGATII